MKPGTSFTRREQAYRCVGVSEYWRERDGQFMELLVLESRCADCGARFDLKASRTNAQRGHLRRRCDKHKKPGVPIGRTVLTPAKRLEKAERRHAQAIRQRSQALRDLRNLASAPADRSAIARARLEDARREVTIARWNLRDARLALRDHKNVEALKLAAAKRYAEEQAAAAAAAKAERAAKAEARRQAAQAAREDRQRRQDAKAAEKRQREAARAADAAQRELARLLGTEPATIAPDGPLAGALADVEARHRTEREADAAQRRLIDGLFERPRPVGSADADLARLLE